MRTGFRWSAGVLALASLLVTLPIGAGKAEAVTLREIIELTRAGLHEDVLLALIEVDQRVFPIDPETLKTLKDAGVSPRVIVAIVKSGRDPQLQREPLVAEPLVPEPPPLAVAEPNPPAPHVVVLERTVVREVPVSVPVYVAVGGHAYSRRRSHAADQHRVVETHPYVPSIGLSQPGVHVEVRKSDHEKRSQPVYWGWGGKLRPDSWEAKK